MEGAWILGVHAPTLITMINGINLTRAKRISGWMSDKELEFLAHTARKSNVIIEIGSYFGRSCMALADNTDGIVVAVDPYKGYYETMNPNVRLEFDEPVYQDFLYNMSEHLKSGKVKHFRTTFEKLPRIDADFIFIDGDHSYEGCKSDIAQALLMCNTGGIIAGHDYGTPGFQGVDKIVNEVFGKPNLVETIWWVQK